MDGSGITIGVISDGVTNSHLSVASGDLPSNFGFNTNLPHFGDEGTAMLEIVHDLAPGANLLFSSGRFGQTTMIDSINWLVANGADVIVDDLGFLEEPYFDDGPIADAVQNAIDGGVVYVTSAGNFGDASHWQGQYELVGGALHDFLPGPGADATLDFEVPPNTTFRINAQWSDEFSSSSNDYDLFLLLGNTVVAESRAVQNGNDDPYEALSWANGSNTPNPVVSLVVLKFPSAADRELEIFARGGINVDGRATDADTIFGHAALEDVISVGAVNALDPGLDDVRDYSSRGPSTIYTDFANQVSTQRSTLDVIGVDGVQTNIGQIGLFSNPFNGTSAAAPHMAAIGALLLDARNGMTPAEVSQAFTNAATDIEAPGYDNVAGHGFVNAHDAIMEMRLWQNPVNPLDTNNSGSVSPADRLVIINALNANGGQPIALPDPAIPLPGNFLDANGDNVISAADEALVFDCLANQVC